ncbi:MULTISPECIES: DUF3052 domain-containing protein [unclassified Streptomyces]|uniref:DUF3052 domain-containing protein n=1 Tax=Streptomycetaceae TaxID=2062 RepID=UPI002E7802D4|nr:MULTISPECIES: DUF3052 domain-containing protein [unclassified Streptomyces]MED7952497.1 DUF3052 domain-containing protein [Streptomyces sp. BE303]MEE1822753.1 DUF3052 domain-containing protein [Streptomyces sp. BE20]
MTTQASVADRLGIESGTVVLELGYEEDVDHDVRDAVAERSGSALVEGEADVVVDVALLWFRDGDGDLVDLLVDARTLLADRGVVFVLTPKSGRPGYVEPSEIGESAPTAGLQQTGAFSAGGDWTATRLVAPRSARR